MMPHKICNLYHLRLQRYDLSFISGNSILINLFIAFLWCFLNYYIYIKPVLEMPKNTEWQK